MRTERGMLLYAEDIEDQIVTNIEKCMSVLSHAGISPPMMVMLAGVRMHGTTMMGKPSASMEVQPLRKPDFLLPSVTFEDAGRWKATARRSSQYLMPFGTWLATGPRKATA